MANIRKKFKNIVMGLGQGGQSIITMIFGILIGTVVFSQVLKFDTTLSFIISVGLVGLLFFR